MRPRTVLLGSAVAVVVVVSGVAAYVSGHPGAPVPGQAPAASSTQPAGAAPTGCLGGSAIDDDMVLAAQRRAPHTDSGAVELAASFFRWSFRYPVPTSADIDRVAAVFVPGQQQAGEAALRHVYETNPDQAPGAVPDGTAFTVSTAAGVWNTQPGQQSQDVLVDLRAGIVVDGSASGSETVSESFDMRWEQGAWRVTYIGAVDTRQFSGASRFTAGC